MVFGQETNQPELEKEKKFFSGGNFGLQFGNTTVVNASPLLGYHITDKIKAGIGGTYLYYRYKDPFISFVSNTYAGRVFSRYYFIENAFGHVEYEVLNGNWVAGEGRTNVTSIFVGGGYAQQMGKNGALNLLVLFNINDSVFSLYPSNPIIRVGYNFNIF